MMAGAKPLTYAGRCERYARQRGWAYDPQRMSIGHLTPAQRRRALHKERRSWRSLAAMTESCGLCDDGLIDAGGCNCGSPADASVSYAHERLCGADPCPNGCWERLHPEVAA